MKKARLADFIKNVLKRRESTNKFVYIAKKSYRRGHRPRSLGELAHLEATVAKCWTYSSSLAIFSKNRLAPFVITSHTFNHEQAPIEL